MIYKRVITKDAIANFVISKIITILLIVMLKKQDCMCI